jgi:AGCS family alanine or glycine:cation symporter
MAIVYLLGGIIVIACRIQYLPETFGMIFKFAFVPNAIIGGGIGFALKTAISQGAKRGLFSNEAGMGSTPHAHAQANVKTAHEQGTTAMIGVFIDTFIVLTMTALVVISTLYAGGGPLGNPANYSLTGFLDAYPKANLAQMAFGSIFWGETFGNIFVAVCLFFFAFSTILSWNFFGKINFEYLFGKKYTVIYTVIAIVFVFLGSIFSNDLVWELTDFFNYLMVIPNVIALFALSKLVRDESKEAAALKKAAKANK